jgi:predicted nucleotidyltransferase
VRITEAERNALVEAVGSLLGGASAELILFGSRADDRARGGDIDLLLVVPPVERARLVSERGRIVAACKARVGDQRIDLTIATAADLATDPFFKVSLIKSQVLQRW